MAEDKSEIVVSVPSAKAVPKRWAKQAVKAEAALKLNAMVLEDGPLPGDATLKGRGYVTIPGEKLPKDRVSQPLGQQDLSLTPAAAVNKK